MLHTSSVTSSYFLFVIDLKSDKLESGEKAQVKTETFFVFFLTNVARHQTPLQTHKQDGVLSNSYLKVYTTMVRKRHRWQHTLNCFIPH